MSEKNNEKGQTIGCFGLAAYGMFGLGVLGFLLNFIQGEHRDSFDGEWMSYDRMIQTGLFTLGLGLVFYVIDRIRHRND